MSDRDSALAALIRLAERGEALPPSIIATLERWSAAWRGDPAAKVVARPCSRPAPQWHLDHLVLPALSPVRRAFHARMLGHLLAPQAEALRPSVTILIPVYNRAAMLIEAVESCLAQDWRPLDVLVVDDGSTDDPAAALQRFGGRVQVLRKPNGGVSSARNLGIDNARGDFIQFLDSDNLLRHDALSAKIAAFRDIADAELCFSDAEVFRKGRVMRRGTVLNGGPDCATTDLLQASAIHCPFLMSSAMLPRWVALQADRFETDLRRAEDWRYWFCLGLHGIKAIAIDKATFLRRSSADSLSRKRHEDSGPDIAMGLRCARDLLSRPHHWGLVRRLMVKARPRDEKPVAAPSLALVAQETSAFRRDVIQLCDDGRRDGLSALPVLASLRHELMRHAQNCADASPFKRLAAELVPILARAIATAPALTPADLRFWRSQSRLTASHEPFCSVAAMLSGGIADEDEAATAATLLLRVAPRSPSRRAAKRHLRRKRRYRRAATAWLAAQAFLRQQFGALTKVKSGG
jgi:glycosyltransferase involved in cell wall biosynthesis